VRTLLQDIRFAIRLLLKNPSFAAVAIITLALGIGANTAIFSVINAILLRPLPYPQAERLVLLSEFSEQIPDMSISMANFDDWRKQNTVFESMMPYQNDDVVLTGRGEPERLHLRRVTAGITQTLKVPLILGRALAPEDDKVGAAPVVLLGEGFWQRRFGGDPNIVGKQLVVDGESFTVIGVLSSRMHESMRQTDLFTSLWRLEDKLGGDANRGEHPGIYAYARMKPGVTIAQAQQEMKNIAQRLDQQYPATNGKDSVTVKPLLGAVVEDVRPSLIVLMAAVGFVLLIACANIANLQLARATDRYRELAVRMALGADRSRLVRQMLTESLLLSLIGGVLGLFLAVWVTVGLMRVAPADIPRIAEASLDRSVLLFSLVISILTGVLFGIFPALQTARTDVHDALKEGGRTGIAGGHRKGLRDALVIAEVAISLVLLVGAGLMTKSLWKVLEANSGFRPEHVLTTRFAFPDIAYADAAKRRLFVDQLVAKVQSLPGVEAAGFKNPLLGGWQSSYGIEGRPTPLPGQYPSTDMARVSPEAMQAMGIRLIRGRFFDAHDNEKSQHVCIIDEAFAQQNFSKEDPLGKRINVDGQPDPGTPINWITIVGVVGHVKNYGVDQPSRVEFYEPNDQSPGYGGSLIVRSTSDPAALVPSIRSAVQSLDPSIPVFDVRPLEAIVAESTSSRRLSVILIAFFAALALGLSGLGIYGVISYLVTQRRQEIGIRIALGASSHDVLSMVLRQGARLAAFGILVGLVGAVVLTRLMSSVLFEVSALDGMSFGVGVVLLAGLVLFASWLPARRATRIDPLVALRYE
jgi:putative ABC transport system permease protein